MSDESWDIIIDSESCDALYFVNSKKGFICNLTDNESRICSYENCPIRVKRNDMRTEK